MKDKSLKFSFRVSKKHDQHEYIIEQLVVDDNSTVEGSDKEVKISEFGLILSEFVRSVTSTASVFRFINTLNRDYVEQIISKRLLPAIETQGTSTEAKEGFTKAFLVDPDFMADQKEIFGQISRSISTRDAMGPMILLNLTSSYDVLLSSIIRLYLSKHPQIVDKSDKLLLYLN